MHDRKAFAASMAALGVNSRVEVSEQQRDLYWVMLADLTDELFQRAVTISLQQSRYFPTIAELREFVTPHVDHQAEAVLCFDRIRQKLGTYDPHRGTVWSIRRVAEAEGTLAAEAFAAAGASSAFEREQSDRDLPFLRKRFVESYVAAAVAQAKGRPLQLAEPRPVIAPGSRLDRMISGVAAKLSLPEEHRGDAYEPLTPEG